MKQTAMIVLVLLGSLAVSAQVKKDSCSLEISLITCSPGAELYSLFGHTAIRVRDSTRGMDIVFNYGTFDDTDPLFYVHFTKGIMNYSLSAEMMDSFMTEYELEHRSVEEQILNLTCGEEERLFESLKKNARDENRIYQYHFHTDNCTTRAAEIIENNTDSALVYKNILPLNSFPGTGSSGPGLSFRDMIHEYLYRQHADWSAFGIDLFLGMNLDVKVSNIQAIHFLPDYLYRGMDGARDGNKVMVKQRRTVISFPENEKDNGWFTPLLFFTILFLAVIVFSFYRNKTAFAGTLRIFDIIFFSGLGLIGLLMAYLWIARVDDVCRNNINIFWALPTHLIAVFFIRKKTAWVKYYFLLTCVFSGILLIGLPWWPQRMNTAVLPLLGIIIFRSFYLSKLRDHGEKHIV